MSEMNDFYPEITPYNHFMLDVGNGHQLYVEQCGNPQGQPVVFIHGGPGGGCSTNDRRFFDPHQYHIILFDQRGCGRSLPHGTLEFNNTQYLIEDLEKIRLHLDLERWHVFGGSWGSTLALAYAQAHPSSVRSMVLRGIFLAREQDTQWAFTDVGGAPRIFPDHWQQYLAALPEGTTQPNVQSAYQILTGDDHQAAMKLAKAWSMWEIRSCTLQPNPDFLAHYEDDDACWTLARHECHFMNHHCFLDHNQLLDNCDKIADIPTTIVHGRYDIICAFEQAWLLHQHLPASKLVISETAGHASCETETKHHLINATQHMLTL